MEMVSSSTPPAQTADRRSARVPIVGVGVVVFKGDEVLLVRRAKGEKTGEWSIPGGHLEWGENLEAAARRELAEETGIRLAALSGLADVAELIRRDDRGRVVVHYVLVDYWACVDAGAAAGARAMSDVSALLWQPVARLDEVPMWEVTRGVIRKAAALARIVPGARGRKPGS